MRVMLFCEVLLISPGHRQAERGYAHRLVALLPKLRATQAQHPNSWTLAFRKESASAVVA